MKSAHSYTEGHELDPVPSEVTDWDVTPTIAGKVITQIILLAVTLLIGLIIGGVGGYNIGVRKSAKVAVYEPIKRKELKRKNAHKVRNTRGAKQSA